jgi:hypothetical protein
MKTMRQHHKSFGENTNLSLLAFAWAIKPGKSLKQYYNSKCNSIE